MGALILVLIISVQSARLTLFSQMERERTLRW
jgi:hypothetical protein